MEYSLFDGIEDDEHNALGYAKICERFPIHGVFFFAMVSYVIEYLVYYTSGMF